MNRYPSNFPCPLIEGYQYTVAMGVISSEGTLRYERRRTHETMPHLIKASFMLKSDLWGIWQAWLLDHGYDWFILSSLPTMYKSQTNDLVVRLVADTLKVKARTEQVYKIDAEFEVSPAMYRLALEAL